MKIILSQKITNTIQMQQVTIAHSIKQVYPGIEDELCNRHSVHLTRIKHKFQHLYDKYQPTVFVIGKGLCQFTQPIPSINSHHNQCTSYMTIQNGIVIGVAKTTAKSDIYINYNKWEQEAQQLEQINQHTIQTKQGLQEELVLSYKGQIHSRPNLSKQSEEMCVILSEVYVLAVEDVSLGKIGGGILYIDGQLEDGCFYQREALIWAFYVAILWLNGLHDHYSIQHIHSNLFKYYTNTNKNPQLLHSYSTIFHSQHNTITLNTKIHHISSNTHKFVICKLVDFNKQTKIKSNLYKKLRQYQDKSIELIGDQDICVEQLCGNVREYCRSYIQNYNQHWQMLQLMDKYSAGSHGFLVTQHSSYIAIYTPNHLIPDLIRKLSQLLKTTLPSPTHPQDFLKQGRKYPGKWSSNNMDQFIFSTMGCVGMSILDPQQELWYCQ